MAINILCYGMSQNQHIVHLKYIYLVHAIKKLNYYKNKNFNI